MDNDDLPIGLVLSRREAIAFLGATGALILLGCSADEAVSGTTPDPDASSCVVKPELTQGPCRRGAAAAPLNATCARPRLLHVYALCNLAAR